MTGTRFGMFSGGMFAADVLKLELDHSTLICILGGLCQKQ